MATRASPPLSSPMDAPMHQWPKSKLDAMFASSDDDSDKENQVGSKSPDVRRASLSPLPLSSSSAHKQTGVLRSTSPISAAAGNQDSKSDTENDDIVVPQPRKGTLAARMQAQARPVDADDNDEAQSSDDGNAYERVRRMIFSRKGANKQPPRATAEHKASDEGDDGFLADSEREGASPASRTLQQTIMEREIDTPPEAQSPQQSRSASTSPSKSPSSRASPGLFVSPEKTVDQHQTKDEDANPGPNEGSPTSGKAKNRLQALLERKRKERVQRESLMEQDVAQESSDDNGAFASKPQRPKKIRHQALRAESETDGDPEVSKKLTQQARPTRKASKRALEELNRETQRMSRNMQLTHEARTKTKFSKEDFLAKFNFRQPTAPQPDSAQSANAVSSSSAPATSDAEAAPELDTPPSSPPSLGASPRKALQPSNVVNNPPVDAQDEDEELPDLNTLLSQIPKDNSMNRPSEIGDNRKGSKVADQMKRYNARRFAKSAKPVQATSDSEDDLEIVKPAQPSRLAVFNNLPGSKARESHSIHALKALAHLHDTEKLHNRGQKSMTPSELQVLLQRRAREQAKNERDEKIQRLRDRGVLVQTAEEKEQEQMQLENMLDRARKEAEEIAKREKETAKREGRADDDGFPDSDDEDRSYRDSEDEEEDVQLSGSEDELIEGGEQEGEGEIEDDSEVEGSETGVEEAEQADNAAHSLVDNEAGEDSEEEEKDEPGEDFVDDAEATSEQDNEEASIIPNPRSARHAHKRVIISDDEDEEDTPVQSAQTQLPLEVKTPKQASTDAFGFSRKKPTPVGLSQLFAGTMAESQTQADAEMAVDDEQDSLDFLRGMPHPDLPDFTTPLAMETPSVRVRDSQVDETPTRKQNLQLGLVQFDTQTQIPYAETQGSEMPDPTQDVGFQVGDSQAPMEAASYATVDTLPVAASAKEDSQLPKRRGRLIRKTDINETGTEELDFDDTQSEQNDDEAIRSVNVFEVMRDAAKRPAAVSEFDKKKSEAKGMVEEQAEESEDEYAGLGGASDDESTADIDEATRQMIDDDDNAKTNERDIAAYYAEKERLEDEKGIERLYKDVVNGGLRRKRGAQDDLWESDDEDEIATRRRAAKQREFAKMRKALLADERLGKIAENPKQQAFFQSIEDRDEIDDLDFLDQPEEVSQIADSQSGAVQDSGPLSNISINKRKYSDMADDTAASQDENRPPPNLRRTTKTTRPTTLADIRNTLSEIIGQPESILDSQDLLYESPSQSGDEDDADVPDANEDLYNDVDDLSGRSSQTDMLPPPVPPRQSGSLNRRRTAPNVSRTAVIDRMALKRAASSSMGSNEHSSDKLAFHAPAKAAYSGFRVPSLLRRATTNGSIASTSSTSTTASGSSSGTNGGLGGKESVKMGGSKKSSVNYYVRETERRARVELVEKERQEGRERVGKMRRSAVVGGMGALVGGRFE